MVVRWTMRDYWQGQAKRQQFYFAGGEIAWQVPAGVDKVRLKLRGGIGGFNPQDKVGVATGGYVDGWLDVTEGDVLYIRVGGNGAIATGTTGSSGGYNGGGKGGNSTSSVRGGFGGGGATDVRLNGHAIANIVALAGGGGGNSGGNHLGGPGGDVQGGDATEYDGTVSRYCGRGGTQTVGGRGGDGQIGSGFVAAQQGSTLQGGNGASHPTGGGGSGWEGGGGGGSSPSNSYGGGGGSNYVGGLMDDLQIVNKRGVLTTKPPQPQVEISYTAQADVYQFDINPNDGGSPSATKQIAIMQNAGPNRINLVQEGNFTTPTLSFSGVILEQGHYESLEYWFDRRVLIEMRDDLGRTFYGIFSKFAPKRVRRPYNPWYHTYDAEFVVSAYVNASGQRVYGRIL